jgi:hypothetical protein
MDFKAKRSLTRVRFGRKNGKIGKIQFFRRVFDIFRIEFGNFTAVKLSRK